MVEQLNKKYKRRMYLGRDDYDYYLKDANHPNDTEIEIIRIGAEYYTHLTGQQMFFFLSGCLAGKDVRCSTYF